MATKTVRWFHNKAFWVEIFIIANLAFLALDVFIAHSVNAFAHWGEWIPFYFSLVAPIFLLIAMVGERSQFRERWHRWVGLFIGWISILIGIVGMLFHLDSQFFSDMTLKSLVYTAPFAAPLAFTGLGFLLLLNRTVPAASVEWGKWVIFLTLGGFVGNFALSLCDHAQNGFFDLREWIPVCVSAITVGFLLTAVLIPIDRTFLLFCLGLMVVSGGVGGLGFYYHLASNLHGVSSQMADNFLYGSPVFAPLLFPNLALLGGIGIWDVMGRL
jgi:hypothetical protein